MHYLFYHEQCSDGMMAATIAFKALTELGQKVFLVPSPSGIFPTVLPNNYQEPTEGDTIYILDTCFPPSRLDSLSNQVKKRVIVLDHHDYSKDWVLENGIHDMNRSGCRLTWEFFYPGIEPPFCVLCIEDRDLCKWSLSDSKHFTTFFCIMIPINLQSYLPFLDASATDPLIIDAITKGKMLVDHIDIQIQNIAKNAQFCYWWGHRTAKINSNLYVPELSDYLLNQKDDKGNYLYEVAFIWSKNEKTHFAKIPIKLFLAIWMLFRDYFWIFKIWCI